MSSAFYSLLHSITSSITSRYEVKSPISTSGLWKIYAGVRKTTGKQVAIFIFEKKVLDVTLRKDRGSSKHSSDRVYEQLKKEASHLARLRHPSILEVVEPVTESRSSIVFVTEPLVGALSHLLKGTESSLAAAAAAAAEQEDGFALDELEIQKGLLQVGKGLMFLKDANVVHHNLTPEAVFVNAKGDWKIGGLGFGIFLNTATEAEKDDGHDFSDGLPEQCYIDMDYAAPEFVMKNEIHQANDVFSLGCLAYTIHNKGVSLLQTFNNTRTYERKIKALDSLDYSKVPPHLQGVMRQMLALHPSQRLTLEAFQNSKYFDNLLVSTMKFMESFPEKTREEKAQFMKGLARVLGQFSDRVVKRKILPTLLEELKDHPLLPYTVPNILLITQQLTQKEFCDLILPSLKPVFLIRDPPQNMIVLLEKLDVFQQKTPRETFRDDVMPLMYAALETPVPAVQEKALRILPSLCDSLDYTIIKGSLFQRVQALFVQTTILSVKVSTLICFHAMIKTVDKFTMQEKLLPLLENIKTKEPAVMLATLAVYDEMGKYLEKELIATQILPQLWKMSFGPLLNIDQFKKFMKTIKELTLRVEEAHVKHLQQVRSLEEQTKSVGANGAYLNPSGEGEDASFESLVQGKTSSNLQQQQQQQVVKDSFFPSTPPSVSSTVSPMTPTTVPLVSATLSAFPHHQPMAIMNQFNTSSYSIKPPQQQQQQQQQQQFQSTSSWSILPPTTSSTKPIVPMSMGMNTGMSGLSLQNKASSEPNYSALHSMTSSMNSSMNSSMKPWVATPIGHIQTQPNLHSMGLLQPTSIRTTHTPSLSGNDPSKGHRSNQINAFDPLG